MNFSNYEPNKIYSDEFGRPSGIFLVDKPVGKTSHDMVYEYRRKLDTRKVGHAGALDPFATGLLIILAGKALKLSDQFLNLDKEYEAEIAFGFKTDTLDTEGKIIEVSSKLVTQEELEKSFTHFMPEYNQKVPIYSSVKVQGDKLRELARRSDGYKIIEDRIQFYRGTEVWKDIPLPFKLVKIYELKLIGIKESHLSDYSFEENFKNQLKEKNIKSFQTAKIKVSVSKGTYIRKLAEDIGEVLGVPAMLINLRRTRVGEFRI